MNLKLLLLMAAIQLLSSCAGAPKDTDMDGIPDNADMCPQSPEDVDQFDDQDGCADADNDKDGVCDLWVSQSNQSMQFAGQCVGADQCNNDPLDPKQIEDKDGFKDEDGCFDQDNDDDGIYDKKDQCPLVVEDKDGFEDADGCPELDNDKDGVLDSLDQCAIEAEDKDGFEDADGCPELDNDKDGIRDTQDQCPNQAEDRNGFMDEDGCVDGGKPVDVPAENRLSLQFTTGEVELRFEDKEALDIFAATAKTATGVSYTIEVHTPVIGEQNMVDYMKLLNDRQKLVLDYLVSRGVGATQLSVIPVTEADYLARQDAYQTLIRKK